MKTKVSFSSKVDEIKNRVYLINEKVTQKFLSEEENKYLLSQLENKQTLVSFNRFGYFVFVFYLEEKEQNKDLENLRIGGFQLVKELNTQKITQILVNSTNPEYKLAFTEGIYLGNYQFLKYFKDKEQKANALKEIILEDNGYSKEDKAIFISTLEGVVWARDLGNEPLSYLTAHKLSEEISAKSSEAGYQVQVLDKKQIEALKMGGLLAVNRGSIEPPTFNIIEYNPQNAKNEKPIVLVGKGVVFDTGGLSLKPTAHSMDLMKSDMCGAAAVAGAIYAIAKAKLDIHIVGLIPATENRPGQNAYAPGDVVNMYDGTTVEVLNTDAEGRMILADALAYAKKYNPKLVIDLATLTGAAVRAIDKEAIATMPVCDANTLEHLKEASWRTYERIWEFPMWEEYGESLKSDIADLKNLGGANAGMITAGKFLEHFTDYPWVHLDIASTAFLEAPYKYHGKNATGAGVRLLVEFLKNYVQ